MERDREFLAELQSMSMGEKFNRTLGLIGEWHNHYDNKVYVSLSGGKDSTVLADIDAKWCKLIGQPLNLVFSNTGLEYPEIQRHVRELKPYFESKYGIEVNLTIVTPKMAFPEVVKKYGYPLIGKEVAEAIYYARRLRRERERENGGVTISTADGRTTPNTHTHTANRGTSQTGDARTENLIQTSTARNRRTVLMGEWGKSTGNVWKSGGQKGLLIQTSTARTRRTILQGEWREAGVVVGTTSRQEHAEDTSFTTSSTPNGQTGEWGVFSNPEEQFGTKSQFNKEKWLPLARDVPVLISHYCCHRMKKQPLMSYQSKTGMKPFLGTMAEESRLRTQAWIRHGCNAFEGKKNTSQPLSFWTEQDVLAYIQHENLPIASVYGEIVAVDDEGNEYDPSMLIDGCGTLKCTGCQRTGCIFCGFGAHLEKPGEGRFERLAYTHPKQYDYCINGGEWQDNPYYDPTAPEYDGEWKNWNPKKIWMPNQKGLGMGKVFDLVNEIYGKDFLRY